MYNTSFSTFSLVSDEIHFSFGHLIEFVLGNVGSNLVY